MQTKKILKNHNDMTSYWAEQNMITTYIFTGDAQNAVLLLSFTSLWVYQIGSLDFNRPYLIPYRCSFTFRKNATPKVTQNAQEY